MSAFVIWTLQVKVSLHCADVHCVYSTTSSVMQLNVLLTLFSRSDRIDGSSFSCSLMAQVQSVQGINQREKTRIRNLQYGLRKRGKANWI